MWDHFLFLMHTCNQVVDIKYLIELKNFQPNPGKWKSFWTTLWAWILQHKLVILKFKYIVDLHGHFVEVWKSILYI